MKIFKFINLIFKDREGLRKVYYTQIAQEKGLNVVEINNLINLNGISIKLKNFNRVQGNVSYLELLYICLLVKCKLKKGENFLEIGTFNGNTIFNVSLNVPENSICYTIDLPLQESVTISEASEGDLGFIRSPLRKQAKHLKQKNIKQFYCNSTKFNFSCINFNAAFIDGSHHYTAVAKDTQNVLRFIKRPGFIIWHDYYGYNEVSQVIHKLIKCSDLQINKLKDTSLCLLTLN
ncbi:hypothetical protein CL633_01655 [bacterium]|nr:hypothetical protein [bacterium]|tara:strand:+ start:479 stop:1180 length:702 start_codon:yes stop_codon:yes gene_type:complete